MTCRHCGTSVRNRTADLRLLIGVAVLFLAVALGIDACGLEGLAR